MIPGPYVVCHVTLPDPDSEASTYRTLAFGYDTASQAYAALPGLAAEAGVDKHECVVIRHIESTDAERFTN